VSTFAKAWASASSLLSTSEEAKACWNAASASFSFSSAARLAASFSLAVSGFAGAAGASPSGVAWSEARVNVRVRCFVRATG